MVHQKQLVVVLAPAKLNLSLDVAGLLPNGYHDLDMVMQTIDLYERITLRRSADLTLRLPGSFVPPNDKNTAYKAAVAFFHYTGLLAGVDITIQKHVPVRAGMAGGSADAAGVLVGLNELYNAQLSMSELCAIGAGIGADVPFALMGGTCRVKGVGDLIKPLPPCPDCWFVVVMPSVGISTPEAFKRYDIMGSPVHPDCERQEQAIRENDLAAMCTAAGNALEHCSGAVETAAICKQLNAQGAVTSLMTGSGAAVFGVFDDDTAYDALIDLKGSSDIIADMEQYFDEVIQAEYIGYDEAHYALVSAAVIDSVINSFVYRCDEEDYFEWTSSQKCFDFSPLKQKAVTAIGAILSDNSELRELWEENEELYEAWKEDKLSMQKRLQQ